LPEDSSKYLIETIQQFKNIVFKYNSKNSKNQSLKCLVNNPINTQHYCIIVLHFSYLQLPLLNYNTVKSTDVDTQHGIWLDDNESLQTLRKFNCNPRTNLVIGIHYIVHRYIHITILVQPRHRYPIFYYNIIIYRAPFHVKRV